METPAELLKRVSAAAFTAVAGRPDVIVAFAKDEGPREGVRLAPAPPPCPGRPEIWKTKT